MNLNFMDYFKQVKIDKKKYREKMEEMKQLPKDYQVVYDEIQKFVWQFSAGDGMDMLNALYNLIEFFEEGAANDVPALELVGNDVGDFAETMLREVQAKTQMNELKRKVNERVKKRLSE